MDEVTNRRLAEVRSLAEELDPGDIEAEIGRARIEAYQAGMRFAADYVEHGPARSERPDIPLPRV
ncbi:hypothetical protein SAMN02982929_07214 [Saccharopolyspora kobensis]|uniref:Uncharacterized protein n=1 Tax=Saccharopolyspora kobensis TaxID=146035 RepID=A0A1H6EN00_9PSEU|nr:hypothetical protein [Saccharopolyspora kobensis]SEG98773.1 hypothetical protein SAMN02982929_07214 [Saccharopolyspora kobensis]SFF29089.1 hypothetical protein SAMN05216506_12611 [Saccharopolyspora kobensis]